MRDPGNMLEIAALGIDYMGFIFYNRSPRSVVAIPDLGLPGQTRKTGVFVNSPLHEIIEKCMQSKIGVVQLHGDEPPVLCAQLKEAGFEVIKAISVQSRKDFDRIPDYEEVVDTFLLDTKTVHFGGSGKRFDWSLLDCFQSEVPFFLSGGIRPGMASEIRGISHPALGGLDLNSGFEEAPGLKSVKRIKKFIDEIRS